MTRNNSSSFFNNPMFVGFESLAEMIARDRIPVDKSGSYPPFNVIRTSESEYKIEVAVAGFTENEIDISIEGDRLTIDAARDDSESRTFVHRGIAERGFKRQFTLADSIEVKGAELVNGILSIQLLNVIPEKDHPRKIEIGSGIVQKTKQLLTE